MGRELWVEDDVAAPAAGKRREPARLPIDDARRECVGLDGSRSFSSSCTVEANIDAIGRPPVSGVDERTEN